MSKNIVKITNHGMITIPLQIRKDFHLKPGSSLALIEDEGHLIIVPLVDIEEMRPNFVNSEDMRQSMKEEHTIEMELEK
jgi:AbrB family looped-hinge helix DNA binding protein